MNEQAINEQTATMPVKKDPEEQIIEYCAFGSDEKVKLTIRLIRDMIAHPTKSGKPPSLRDCYHFALMCRARGLNPFEGDAYLLGYDGRDGPRFSLITAHQAFLKRAELNPDYDGMDSGVVVLKEGREEEHPGDFMSNGEQLLGAWAKIHFKNKSHPIYRKINLEKYKKPYGIWAENPAMMIVKCAEADALRSAFPTKLGGLYLREEMAMIERERPAELPIPSTEGRIEFEPETATEKLVGQLKAGPGESDEEQDALPFDVGGYAPTPAEEMEGVATPKLHKPKPVERKPPAPKAAPSDDPLEERKGNLGEMLLMLASGSKKEAQEKLVFYLQRAGVDITGRVVTLAKLTEQDINCAEPYVKADFDKQIGGA